MPRTSGRAPGHGPRSPKITASDGRANGIGWQGYQLTARFEQAPADEELAALFAVEPGTALLRRNFVFYARGEPEQISVSFLPLDLVEGTPVADPAREPWPGGTLAQLASLGHPVSRVEESVTARMPGEPEARTLRMPAGGTGLRGLATYNFR